MGILQDPDLLRRAYAAWFRECDKEGHVPDMPAERRSHVEQHGGKDYVVLRNGSGVLAVYRVRNDGKLKRLRRPPAELRE